MKVDHVGIAVKNLERAIQEFETLGYQFGEKIEDTARNVLICFGENGSYRVELVQALDKMRASPIDGILKKTGGVQHLTTFAMFQIIWSRT